MDKYIKTYRDGICELINRIAEEHANIEKAADVIAQAVAADNMVHVIGPGGHSNIAVEEILWRAGGLAHLNAILDSGTNLIHGAKRSNVVERTPGYARAVLDSYRVGKSPGEVMIIVNAYGINAMTIDTVEECKKRGVFTIGVTSTSFCELVKPGAPARHPSGKNLYQEVDIFIDNHLPAGDSIVSIDGFSQTTGSTSTFCNCFVMNCIVIETVKKLVSMGVNPPVYMSANMPEGDAHNKALEEKYYGLIRHL